MAGNGLGLVCHLVAHVFKSGEEPFVREQAVHIVRIGALGRRMRSGGAGKDEDAKPSGHGGEG